MAITWLADVLRAASVTVVEHSGWKTRTVDGTWSPRFGIVHATAAPDSQADDTQIRIVRDGRSDLDGPIANACVDRAGRWHVLAAGRCNTTIAGTSGPYAGQGNTYALGVEACNDNRGGAWPDVQYRAYVRGWAAIARKLGWSPAQLRGHKEHTPGHKTDPTFDMAGFRANVARVLAGEDDDDMTPQELLNTRIGSPALGERTFADWLKGGQSAANKVDTLTAKVEALAVAVATGTASGLMAKLEEIDDEATERAAAEVQRDADLKAWLEQYASGEVSAEEVVQHLADRLAA